MPENPVKSISTEELQAELNRRRFTHSQFPWTADIDTTVEDGVWRRRPLLILDARGVSIARLLHSDWMEMNARILSCAGDGVELARYLADKDSILSELPENKKAAVILAFAKRLLAKAGL